jgi:hypothetical protein
VVTVQDQLVWSAAPQYPHQGDDQADRDARARGVDERPLPCDADVHHDGFAAP